MRFLKLGKIHSKKRGISSVVGGVFFLVLMVTGFTVYFLAIDSQARMVVTQQLIGDVEIQKIKEKFSIDASIDPLSIPPNQLSIQVGNEGNNAVEIADFWIVDKTDPDQPATQYELDYADAHVPVGFSGNILENTDVFLTPAVYDIKVVSTFGTIVRVEFDTLGLGSNLEAQLYAIPPDVNNFQDVTIALYITNVADVEITGVFPILPLDVAPPAAIFATKEVPTVPVDLEPNESTFFTWRYTLVGTFDSVVDFTGQATGSMNGLIVTSNPAFDRAFIRDPSGGGAGDDPIIDESFLARPKIFMIVPLPFGDDDDDQALWGVNVVNPTPNVMEVRKVTISALTSRPQTNDRIFDDSGPGCVINTVPPTPNQWTCSAQNQITWQDFTTPIVIDPFENFPFLVRVQSGTLATGAVNLETIMVQSNVFTTFGQFGKTAYGSSMANKPGSSLVNVYLSSVPDSIDWNDILSEKKSLPAGDPVELHATIADFSVVEPDFKIEAGSRLIINIPLDWTLNSDPTVPGYDPDFSPIIVQSSIGQTQIIATLAANLPSGAKSLSFTVTPPCVSFTKFYVMYILADGHILDKDNLPHFTIGPLAETVLQVDFNPLCT